MSLDPDGTMPPWLVAVVRRQTGVVYGAQCAGVATQERLIEGFLVPLAGANYEVDESRIDLNPFTEAFHEGGNCIWGWKGESLPGERLALLQTLVEDVAYWHCSLNADDSKQNLRLDMGRITEMAEAWVPVETPDGSGVLLYKNCD